MNRRRLSKPPAAHASDFTFESAMFQELLSPLSASEFATLTEWLQPVHDLMDEERRRLLAQLSPGTRQWLFPLVHQFLTNSPHRLLQIHASAGAGKSIMAAVVADALQARSLLGGVFFAGSDGQLGGSVRALIHTMAHGLARMSGFIGRRLLEESRKNRDLLHGSVPEVFEALIIRPLQLSFQSKALFDHHKITFIIDSVDECGCDLLELFLDPNSGLPDQIKLIITRHPDGEELPHFPTKLKESMNKGSKIIRVDDQNLDNFYDVRKYAQTFLSPHRLRREEILDGSRLLVEKSAATFLRLVVACNILLMDASSGAPVTLEMIQAIPSRSIDELYLWAMKSMARNFEHPYFLFHVLATIATHGPLTEVEMEEKLSFLGSLQDDDSTVRHVWIGIAVRRLGPVLNVDPSNRKLRLIHRSAKAILVDPIFLVPTSAPVITIPLNPAVATPTTPRLRIETQCASDSLSVPLMSRILSAASTMTGSGHPHPLMRGAARRNERFPCDTCSRPVRVFEPIFSCVKCDYDECARCFADSNSHRSESGDPSIIELGTPLEKAAALLNVEAHWDAHSLATEVKNFECRWIRVPVTKCDRLMHPDLLAVLPDSSFVAFLFHRDQGLVQVSIRSPHFRLLQNYADSAQLHLGDSKFGTILAVDDSYRDRFGFVVALVDHNAPKYFALEFISEERILPLSDIDYESELRLLPPLCDVNGSEKAPVTDLDAFWEPERSREWLD
ncbi:hypothetical protein DFJ73DRAFT_86592 [Zopfochytrium polystomum]|nr:hypothetical protein DFJ73DRAFT_86592 [Zopfochytrium polystomum]